MSELDNSLLRAAQKASTCLRENGLMLVTAESCTGGWVAKLITDLAGSSAVFERGYVTYSNASKRALLGVRNETLEKAGAVSEQTAIEMAQGALAHSDADVAFSVTGIAGPDGGNDQKPVGTVCFAWSGFGQTHACTQYFSGSREQIRAKSCEFVLNTLLQWVNEENFIPSD